MSETYLGSGCEGVVSAVHRLDGSRSRRKRFRRRAELERHLVGAVLLDDALRELGWAALVVIPQVLEVDLDQRVVTTGQLVDAAPPPWPAPLLDRRVRARTAVVCAAGLAAAQPAGRVRDLLRRRHGRLADQLTRTWFEGVALDDSSLITDGLDWYLVDF